MASKTLCFLLLLFTCFSCSDEEMTIIVDCQALELIDETNWMGPFTGKSDTVPYIPDTYADYWLFIVDRTQSPDDYIQINGNYGAARYMSYNVYDAEELTSLGSILDKNIEPHCDSYNIFTPDENLNGASTTYTINIVPDHLSLAVKNQLKFDRNIDFLIVMLRYYVGESDYMANVPLPSITGKNTSNAVDVQVDLVTEFPSIDLSPITGQLNVLAQAGAGNGIGFWRNPGNGLLQNFDNQYLVGTSIVQEEEVAVIKLKPPGFEIDFSQSRQVRYWSMNIGDNKTFTYNGIKDEDAIVADDGWTYFVFGRMNNAVESRCVDSKLNFIEWRVPSDTAFFLYRNLVSNNFSGNLGNVPTIDSDDSPLSLILKDAKNYIGAYAPRGQKMTIEQFLNWY